jgi:hypothetical protein
MASCCETVSLKAETLSLRAAAIAGRRDKRQIKRELTGCRSDTEKTGRQSGLLKICVYAASEIDFQLVHDALHLDAAWSRYLE